MGQRLIITESDKNHIKKLYNLNESKELEVFPVDGGYNIGYDKDFKNWDNPQGTANSDFSKSATGYGAGGHKKGHFGVDIFGQKGTPIVAPVDGKVKLNFGNGNTVIIEDPDGFSHWLGHLDSITVKDGQFVEAGTKVGTLGNTGNASGTEPHLHYNVYPTKQGFYGGEDPIEDLKDAIGKSPGMAKNDSGSKFSDLNKNVDDVSKTSNSAGSTENYDKMMLNIVTKGDEYANALKSMF
jgi:murein DD-endopeptidase MepM/ murein hydrolase activator NlpD